MGLGNIGVFPGEHVVHIPRIGCPERRGRVPRLKAELAQGVPPALGLTRPIVGGLGCRITTQAETQQHEQHGKAS
jgi:hypothetical protein